MTGKVSPARGIIVWAAVGSIMWLLFLAQAVIILAVFG